MNKKYPISRKDNIVVQELDGEVLIYDLSKDKAFCLNETSALVWELCDGNKSIAEISQSVGKKLDSPTNEDLVWLAIDQLKKENLIVNAKELDNHFEGMSRREVIKKVGLASMIALPLVTSIIAPTSANAASGAPAPGTVAENGACTSPVQCVPFAGNPTPCCNVVAAGPNICRAAAVGCITVVP